MLRLTLTLTFSLCAVCCGGEMLIGTSSIPLPDVAVERDCLHLCVFQFAEFCKVLLLAFTCYTQLTPLNPAGDWLGLCRRPGARRHRVGDPSYRQCHVDLNIIGLNCCTVALAKKRRTLSLKSCFYTNYTKQSKTRDISWRQPVFSCWAIKSVFLLSSPSSLSELADHQN